MTRYFIKLSYDGTNYHGWQIQPNAPTVQEELNKALSTILSEKIELTGAGRTDTGVHATLFYAHFDTKKDNLHIDEKLIYKLNGFLNKDIAIQNIIKVGNEDHTRFSAISRTYHYFIHFTKDPFSKQFSVYTPFSLDIDKMNEAAKVLYNHSDFTSFSKLHTQVKTNDCKVDYALWTEKESKIVFEIRADRFLRNMVRAIVGTLIEVGKGKLTVQEFEEIIKMKDRSKAKASAPAHGLFLTDIKYPKEIQLKIEKALESKL